MGEIEKKKLAAITAAVTSYIDAERVRPPEKPVVPPPLNPWASSGKMEMMNNRIMMQRRVFR
jgi:hypothetical protein